VPRVAPMLATLVPAPFHLPGWVYEEKYDGIRIVAHKDGRGVVLLTRNLRDRSDDFPAVRDAVGALPASTLVLDGEVVALDAGGVSRFQLLQRRLMEDAVSPLRYAVFDCLYARGRDLTSEPLRRRRAIVETEVREGPSLMLARRLAADGLAAFREARRRGLEGLIAKDEGSPYRPGQRSPAWRKVKVRAEEEFVIGGYTAPAGSRSFIGAILVGAWEGERLRYAGKVGTGFTAATLADLHARFARLARRESPFAERVRERGLTWVEPVLVAQVGFTERTGDGRLRHPVFLGLRDDKPAREVRWLPS
jgi:bifunctional non-homologous end joining protein LigD